jgi:single-stranded-DNA-specific exonuclease
VTFADLNGGSLEALKRLAPFGAGHPEPVLAAQGLVAQSARLVGQGHLKLELAQNGARLAAIGFGLGRLLPQPGQRLEAAFIPRASNYRGPSRLELEIKDLRPVPSA